MGGDGRGRPLAPLEARPDRERRGSRQALARFLAADAPRAGRRRVTGNAPFRRRIPVLSPRLLSKAVARRRKRMSPSLANSLKALAAALALVCAAAPASADKVTNPRRRLRRPRQDHRPHHHFRRLYRRDRPVRRAAGDAARLLHRARRPRRRRPTPSSRSTRSPSTARSSASSPAGCSPPVPGLHAVDHAVYDVWLTDCKTSVVGRAAAQPVEVGLARRSHPRACAGRRAGRRRSRRTVSGAGS